MTSEPDKPSIRVNLKKRKVATTANLYGWHQRTSLHVRDVSLFGRTTLYATASEPADTIALHLKGTCRVHSVTIGSVTTTWSHVDPLEKVLRAPQVGPGRCEADAHFARGASGLTLAVRAASIASNLGELRIDVPAVVPPTDWNRELQSIRDETRKALLMQKLTSAPAAFAISIEYSIETLAGGIFDHAGCIYTTAGVFGDHEGPRAWLPCLDATAQRASHELTIRVTAPVGQGISVVGGGKGRTYLHKAAMWKEEERAELVETLGEEHVVWLERASRVEPNPHVVPPDEPMVSQVCATQVYEFATWSPIPARSLGFAIGPWKVLDDPEYLAIVQEDDDDNEGETSQEDWIRQAYVSTRVERSLLHQHADQSLLVGATIHFQPLTGAEQELVDQYDRTLLAHTIGVPLRALSIMKDVLALPCFRTSSYTQIWIPGAVHGGHSSGALQTCPEALCNPFLGGAIMDAQLLPEPGKRLPFYAGGRVLQCLQARCAIRGWMYAALPLGGKDDVGNGYLHAVTESCIMSMYERAHGAYGEGGGKGSVFYSRRFSATSGVNSPNLDFLPVRNIEEVDVLVDGIGPVPIGMS